MSASSASTKKIAVITGASSGIGSATAVHLARAGFHVCLGARRVDRLAALQAEITAAGLSASVCELDITNDASVAAFCQKVDSCNLLVNNAGLAIGRQSIAESDVANFQSMYDTNVLGGLRMTKALIPKLIASGDGHVINVISIAGSEVYDNGAGYTSSKHAQRALSETMRLEFHGKPVRVTDVSPGAVETEFSVVRFAGDAQAAKKVYEGFTPLTADDVAEVIAFAATRPKHVNLDRIVLKPVAQATTMRYDRTGTL